MPDNQLVKYNSNPISRFFNKIFSILNLKSKNSVELNNNIEKLLQSEFSNEEQLNYARELLKDFISRNGNVMQTLNVKMLNRDLVDRKTPRRCRKICRDDGV